MEKGTKTPEELRKAAREFREAQIALRDKHREEVGAKSTIADRRIVVHMGAGRRRKGRRGSR